MKIVFIICLWIFGGHTWAQIIENQIAEVNTLTFPGELRSPNIPIKALGDFFELPANCAKRPTSFIRSDTFTFPNSSLGKIDSCSMTYLLVQDTIRKIIISLPSDLSIKQAGKQAARQFGKPSYHKEDNTYVYAWNYASKGEKPATIRLEVYANLVSGEMTMEKK